MIGAAVKLLEDRADLFKHLLKLETGQPPTIVDMMQYGASVSALQYYAGAADKFTWNEIRDGIYGQTLVTKRARRRGRPWWRGTCRCSWLPTSSAPRCWPAAPSCSSPPPRLRCPSRWPRCSPRGRLPEGVLSVVPAAPRPAGR